MRPDRKTKRFKPVQIGREILDRARGDTCCHGRLGNSRCNAQDQALIERRRDQVVRAEGFGLAAVGTGGNVGRFLARKAGNCLHRGPLHFLVDGGRPDVERAPEDVGEAQDVVDLVRVVGPSGTHDHVVTDSLGVLRHDFRIGVGERQDQRALAHLFHHARLQHPGSGQPQEDIGAVDYLIERPQIRLLGKDRLPFVHQRLAAFIDDAFNVGNPDVFPLRPQRDEHVEAGKRSRARTGRHNLGFLDLLAGKVQTVANRGADDDRRAMLIVVKDRDLHTFPELRFNHEAFGCLDVFQVDTAKGRLQNRNRIDEFFNVGLGHLDIEDVDAGELLEENRLAFHHRLGCQRTDVAETEHCRAV